MKGSWSRVEEVGSGGGQGVEWRHWRDQEKSTLYMKKKPMSTQATHPMGRGF